MAGITRFQVTLPANQPRRPFAAIVKARFSPYPFVPPAPPPPPPPAAPPPIAPPPGGSAILTIGQASSAGPDAQLYGVDILLMPDLNPGVALIGGVPVFAQDLVHRQNTRRGSLFFHPNDGIDVRAYLSGTFNLNEGKALAQLNSDIQNELIKDERVATALVTSVYDLPSETLTLTEQITPKTGPTFTLIVGVTQATVSLLGIR